MQQNRKFIELRIDALNHALEGIPQERVRFHTCYSINVAPRVHDLEMKHYADLMLKVRAQAYSIEAANPRHEHEWRIWKDIKLPDDKILIPGVVSHCVYQVEHPELVAERMKGSRLSSDASGSSPAPTVASPRRVRGTRCIRTWLGQSSHRWKARASPPRGSGLDRIAGPCPSIP